MAGKRAVTTRDIAEELNLAVSTVGRALAHDSRIAQATRRRVQEKADELGYIGNVAARMMRGVRSTVVGLVVPDVRNAYYSTVAHSLAQILSEAGFQVMLSEANDDPDAELDRVRGMIAARVAGIIIVPTRKPRAETASLLRDIPHAQFLRYRPELGEQWFGLDERSTLRTATQHLYARGHRSIAYFGGEAGLSTTDLRFQGYLDVIDVEDDNLVVHTSAQSVSVAREALGRMLSWTEPPTAVVMGSVQVTEGLLQELAERRVSVPNTISLVGFGDEPGFAWWGPGLTTIALPVDEVANACASWMLSQLGDGGSHSVASRFEVAGELVERGSTAQRPAGQSAGPAD